MRRILRRGQCTWIWQLGAAAGLTVLGFWDLLEQGQWVLDGYDPCDCDDDPSANKERMRGMCVIEDCPTIIMARPTHGRGVVKWVDAGNLGVDGWKSVHGAAGLAMDRYEGIVDGIVGPREIAAGRALALRAFLRDWQQTVADLGLGSIRATAAAQAWHGWRGAYMSEPILCHNDAAALRMERGAMAAGRCECYRLGLAQGPVYELDIDSHYPACAVGQRLPLRHKWTGTLGTDNMLKAMQDGWAVIARVNVQTAEPIYPCREGGLIIFPTGKFTTTLAGPELSVAIARGDAWCAGLCALYETGRPFDKFIERVWLEKEMAEASRQGARRALCKSLLNSLVGKTAQNGFRWVDHPYPFVERPFSTWQGQHPETGEPCRWRAIAWHSQYEDSTGEHPDSCPAIAAYVMSAARLVLYDLITTAGPENVYYCDTDSLFTNEEGFHGLCRSGVVGNGALGKLRCKRIHDSVDFRGFRSYNGDNGSVCSGVPKDAGMPVDGGWCFWVPERLKDSMRVQRAPRPVLNIYRMPAHRSYRHGEVLPSGHTVPFKLEKW